MVEPGNGKARAVLELRDIHKTFGATHALSGVSMSVELGEFVALLGPNGAGKSTLIRILDGVYTADSGEVTVRSGAGGMGVVHQDLGLVPTMTVAENLALGTPDRRWRNPAKEARSCRKWLEQVGLGGLDPFELVETLNLGTQALIAVAKILSGGARVVIVDELTAGLHPREARWLVQHLRDAAHRGATVVMVTHKLREVVGVTDRYVVLLDGKVALDSPSDETSFDDLVRLMSSGRSISDHQFSTRTSTAGDTVVCSLENLTVGAAGPVDLELRRGEIVGLTGQVGSGLHELAYAAAGLVPATSGAVVAPGARRTCVPAHRESEGMFPEDTVGFNLAAGTWPKWRQRSGLLAIKQMRQECDELAGRLSLVPRDLDEMIAALSGGNQQKSLLGRALLAPPDLLVLCEPTRGVDVATRREIYSQVRRVAESGVAVLIATTDIEDLGAMADRAAVLDADGCLGHWASGSDIINLEVELV